MAALRPIASVFGETALVELLRRLRYTPAQLARPPLSYDTDAALGRAHMTVNKNAVPNDPRPPMVTSGLRIGTPAATTRGFKEAEIEQLAHWIADVLDHINDESVQKRVRKEVEALCEKFPLY